MHLVSDSVIHLCEEIGFRSRASFIVMRWVELLDNATPFCLSVHSRISPITAIRELSDILELFSHNEHYLWMHLIDAARRCASILKEDTVLDRPKLASIKPSISPILRFLEAVDGVREEEDRIEAVSEELNALRDLVPTLKAQLETHYVSECIENMRRQAGSKYTRPRDFRKLDDAVSCVATEAVRRGRAPRECSDRLLSEVRANRSDPIGVIIGVLHRLLEDPPGRFQVAVVFDQVRRIRFDLLEEDFGFRRVRPGHVRWSSEQIDNEHPELQAFCSHHWFPDSPPKQLKKQQPSAVIGILEVDAWDREDARIRGLGSAEVIADLINAGNRTRVTGVKRKALVREVSTNIITGSKGNSRWAREAKPLRLTRPGVMRRSLRFASRANAERSWIMAILFYWISLENLFSSGTGATARVQNIVPCASARTAIRDLVTYSRQLVSVASTKIRDLPGWDELYRESEVECASSYEMPDYSEVFRIATSAAYRSCLADREGIPVYLEYRLLNFQEKLTSTARLIEWSNRNQQAAKWTLSRALYLRNRTVHEALFQASSERALATACREVVDSAFEVSAMWINKGEPDTFRAMRAFRDALTELQCNWGSREPAAIILSGVILGHSPLAD